MRTSKFLRDLKETLSLVREALSELTLIISVLTGTVVAILGLINLFG